MPTDSRRILNDVSSMVAGEVYSGMKDPVSKVTDPPSEFTKFLAVSSAFVKVCQHAIA